MSHAPVRRRAAAGAAVAATLAVSVVGAVAAPAHAYDFVTSSCPGFDVGVTVVTVAGTAPPPGNPQYWHRYPNVIAAGESIWTLTNMSTGATTTVRMAGSQVTEPKEPIPGATTFTVRGQTFALLDGGPYAPEGPSTTLYTGTVAIQDDNDVYTVRLLTGTSVDLCAALGG